MENSLTLTIGDDDGFIGIVNADNYKSFVATDWTFQQLKEHLIKEMNSNNLILWATDSEREWNLTFVSESSNEKSFKEFNKTIQVTNGKLFLTNYTDLTMAATYADEKIPNRHGHNLLIELKNGQYEFKIRQLIDSISKGKSIIRQTDFEIVVKQAADRSSQEVDQIFWWTE